MTLYQQEMLRKLGRLDCAGRYDEEKGLLVISSGGTGLCCQDKKGYLSWESEKIRTEEEKAVLSQIGEQAKLIRAYVGQYENSPSMGIPEVEGYRRMAECGDTVMAGMYSEQHGFMFTTWTQNGDRSRVTNGDYSPNYEYVNIKTTAINILKGFFACSLIGVVPVQLYKFCTVIRHVLNSRNVRR